MTLRARGFTLLEVMISVAILALGLSTIFGSSVLAARSTAHARMVTSAALLAQCRMTAVEAYLRQNQLPEADQNLDDPPETGGERCCEEPFTCTARVERIELPQPTDVSTAAGDRLLGAATGAAQGTTFGGDGGVGGGGAIGQLAGALGALGGGTTDPAAGLAGALGGGGAPGGGLASAGAPNLQGMAAELLTGIYPTLKPMLEGAIRKVTVTVRWNEGSREFSVDVVQYVTNPGQTLASGEALDAINRALGGNPPPGGQR
jgi:prepilin-type N-terminal cleavage/methylation domain-containing protein